MRSPETRSRLWKTCWKLPGKRGEPEECRGRTAGGGQETEGETEQVSFQQQGVDNRSGRSADPFAEANKNTKFLLTKEGGHAIISGVCGKYFHGPLAQLVRATGS